MQRVLGIETSCDETGLAIYDAKKGLLSQALYSQMSTHACFGGVVPELASRDHVKYLIPLLDEVLKEAALSLSQIDGIAYTAGPGLIGALLTGATFAKSLAFALDIPALAVHHLEAHLLAARLEDSRLDFPFIVLLVSGGHTQLIKATRLGDYELLGDTLDDAVGEAFDKTAKLMGLPYPGGALLASLADSSSPDKFPPFPRPMLDRPGLDFSFSGLKTHVVQVWHKSSQDELVKGAIASAFQAAVVDVLVTKCQRALQQTGLKQLVVAGGVGANQALRTRLKESIGAGAVYFPKPAFCTDNGAMVAYAGCLHLLNKREDQDLSIRAFSRWPLGTPMPPDS